MTAFQITTSDGVVFSCPDNQYILAAAEAAGLSLPYSCRAGDCSTCAGLITSGSVDQSEQNILTIELIQAGYAVLCLAKPLSDCTIKTDVADELSETLMPHH
jgi:ferredoxin